MAGPSGPPNLEIKIGADASQLKKAAKETTRSLEDITKAAKKLKGVKLEDATGKGADGVDKLEKSTANALPALTDFSRIIQDAPFGIIGVGNNITQLATSFGNLQTKAGGGRAAFQALIGSLSGPGGLVFGISTAVTLLTVFGDSLADLIRGTTGLSESFKKVFDEIGSSKAEFESLSRIVLDITEDLGTRQSALDELSKTYPEYLKGIDLETTRYENLRIALEGANQELLRKAKIDALQGAIQERYKDQAEDLAEAYEAQDQALSNLQGAIKRVVEGNADLQRLDRSLPIKEQVQQLQDLANQYGINRNLLAGVGSAVIQYGEAQRDVVAANAEADKSVQGLVNSLTTLKASQLANKNAAEQFAKGLGEQFDSEEVVLSPGKAKVKKAKQTDFKEFLKGLEEDLAKLDTQNFVDDLSSAAAISVTDSGFRQPDAPDVDDSAIVAQENLLLQAQEFTDQLNNIIQFGVGNAFGNIGTLIGQGLADGELAIQDFGRVVFAGLAQVLSGFGDAAIQAGITSEALKKSILAPLGGGVGAIAAGIALKAFASTLSTRLQQSGANIANAGGVGGIASSGGSTAAISSPSVLQSGEQIVVFEIQGTKLVGVLNRTLQRQGRTVSDLL